MALNEFRRWRGCERERALATPPPLVPALVAPVPFEPNTESVTEYTDAVLRRKSSGYAHYLLQDPDPSSVASSGTCVHHRRFTVTTYLFF